VTVKVGEGGRESSNQSAQERVRVRAKVVFSILEGLDQICLGCKIEGATESEITCSTVLKRNILEREREKYFILI
jgi:hypothetical protein